MQEVEGTVVRWGIDSTTKTNDENKTYQLSESISGEMLLEKAKSITIGQPNSDYGKFKGDSPVISLQQTFRNGTTGDVLPTGVGTIYEGTPYVNLYALWDMGPGLEAYNRYFTKIQADSGEITPEELLRTVRLKDEEDTEGNYLYAKDYSYDEKENAVIIKGKDDAKLTVQVQVDMEELQNTGESALLYTATDSIGNTTKKEVQCRIVDTSNIEKEYETYVRFISSKYYQKSREEGGLEDTSVWKTDPEYAALLDKAMNNKKTGMQKKSARIFGVLFEKEDPGTGTWDYEEEVWEFTHEQVQSVDDFIDSHGYMNYKEEDALMKFREEYSECLK